jgi:hypothetical protein
MARSRGNRDRHEPLLQAVSGRPAVGIAGPFTCMHRRKGGIFLVSLEHTLMYPFEREA